MSSNYCNCPNCRTVDCPNGKPSEPDGTSSLAGATGSVLSEGAQSLLDALSKYPLNGTMWIYPDADNLNQRVIAQCGKELVAAGLASTRPLSGTNNVLILQTHLSIIYREEVVWHDFGGRQQSRLVLLAGATGSALSLRLRPCKWENSCDNCAHQEGRHYCLFWSVAVRDMDMRRCTDWTARVEDGAGGIVEQNAALSRDRRRAAP